MYNLFVFLSWDPFDRKDVKGSSSDKGGKSSCVAVLVFVWLPCTVITIPVASPSRDGTVSPLNNTGRYGSLSLFVNTVMSLHLCVSASRDALVGVRFAVTFGTVTALLDILTSSFCCCKGRELRPLRVLWCQSWLTLRGRFHLSPSLE